MSTATETRTCTKCQGEKPLTEFTEARGGQVCRDCMRAYTREYRARDPERSRARREQERVRHTERKRSGELLPGNNGSETRHCEKCGQKFTDVPGGGRRFCSMACRRTKNPTIVPTAADVAYLAGFIDGEGSLEIARDRRLTANRRDGTNHAPIYMLRVSVGNTNEAVLRWIQERFDGTICGPVTRGENWQPFYKLTLHGAWAVGLVEAVAPFLIVKKQEAECWLAFARYLAEWRRDNSTRDLPEDEIARRELWKQRLEALRPRGKKRQEQARADEPAAANDAERAA